MAERTCPCGHTRGHPEVQQEPQFTLWGWFLLSTLGLTPKPECIIFRCIRCKKSLGSSRDPALLHRKRAPDVPPAAPGAPNDAGTPDAQTSPDSPS